MKTVRFLLAAFFFSLFTLTVSDAAAQCAMCTLNAENSVSNGNNQGRGLNNGILYLLAAPYLAIGAVGFLWYKKYRKKNVLIDIKDEKIHLN